MLFILDANCCVRMHFPTEMCPLSMRHQQTCIRNDAAIIISTDASLDEADDYQSFYKCFYCEERCVSFNRRICVVDVERRPTRIVM